MYALWNVGRNVEAVYGSRRMLYIYLTSGLVGSIAGVLLRTEPALGVGASGAIMGLFGAIIYFALTLKGYRINWQGLLMPVVMTLALGFMVAGIDNLAHVGGLVGGIAAGFFVGAPGERPAWKTVLAGLFGAVLVAIVTGLLPLTPLLFNPKA
jgi:rhomboid protease GluP